MLLYQRKVEADRLAGGKDPDPEGVVHTAVPYGGKPSQCPSQTVFGSRVPYGRFDRIFQVYKMTMLLTIFLAIVFCVAITIMMFAAVAFIQDKKLFSTLEISLFPVLFS